MWTEHTPNKYPLTQQAAKDHAAMLHLSGDRPRDSKQGITRIAWLRQKFDNAKFMTPVWSVAKFNGEWYRVDGGHSSAMLAALPPEMFPVGREVIIRHFTAETKEDLADLFSQFDPKKSMRTRNDNNRAHASIHTELQNVSPSSLTNLLYAITFATISPSARLDDETRTKLIHDEVTFLEWGGARLMKRPRVRPTAFWACIYKGFKRSPDAAKEFVELVAQEKHPEHTHPTRKLARFLRDEAHKWAPVAIHVKCIQAWNAWQEGRTTNLQYHADSPIPDLVVRDGRRAA